MKKEKLLIICGPTATGKTALGIALAKKFNGEIISADSRQIYKGMDIGTGKEISKIKYLKLKRQIKNQKFIIYKLKKIPVWLWDVIKPNQKFSAAEFARLARVVIKHLWKKGKLPILVGGAGFYIKTIINGIDTFGIGPDWSLRKKLENLKLLELQEMLKKIDLVRWEKMNQSDKNNPRRLIRAIEIALQISNHKCQIPNKSQILPRSGIPLRGKNSKFKTKDILFVGLTAPNEVLYEQIDRRVDTRVKEGVIDEITKLIKSGYSWKNSVLGQTIGYKEWRLFFDKKMTKDETIKKWKFDEHAYARRQLTWFKKTLQHAQGEFLQHAQGFWFDITKSEFKKAVEKKATWWYDKNIKN